MECPSCGGKLAHADSDGGDPPITPPYFYLRCLMCGYVDEESYEDEDEDYDFYE